LYAQDVISEFEGKPLKQDKIGYSFLVKYQDIWVHLRGDYTVSTSDKSKLKPILDKLEIPIEEFYTLIGQSVRIGVTTKKSLKNKHYNVIDKLMTKKIPITPPEAYQLPYFYRESKDSCSTYDYEFLPWITFSEKKVEDEDKKPRPSSTTPNEPVDDGRTIIVDDIDDDEEMESFNSPVTISPIETDTFFNDLEDDE